ncbi:MAG: GNAT family N-acetyltransferase [Nocardioides sp.]|uniref:GNAT family N-acetyltransferase n=1 Tax=Nocardioides sp. TaxID=35761 RepID=UPI003266D5F7
MPLEIQDVDLQDETALRAWWEVGSAATAERPGTPWPAWEVSRSALAADNPEYDMTLLGAFDGDAMVGSVMLLVPLHENLHTCSLNVYVLPSRRREGVGSRLVAAVEERAASLGRTTLQSEGYVPSGESGPAELFAAARGYEVASREGIKELTLSDYRSRRSDLVAAVADAADDYTIVTFDTVCPDEHIASFGRLLGMLMSEIPLGDLDLEDSEWTPERLRASEQRCVGIGRHILAALAIAPDGSVAGSSDVRINEADPSHGQIGITLVDPAHRGHRLGMSLKIASHDLALATYPECASVDTCNAEVNEHMNAVNEALGYRSIETLLELQKRL